MDQGRKQAVGAIIYAEHENIYKKKKEKREHGDIGKVMD